MILRVRTCLPKAQRKMTQGAHSRLSSVPSTVGFYWYRDDPKPWQLDVIAGPASLEIRQRAAVIIPTHNLLDKTYLTSLIHLL